MQNTDKTIILFASDHGGFERKSQLIKHFTDVGEYEVVDCGPTEYIEDDDYPLTIAPMCKLLITLKGYGRTVFGIGMGRSGQGEAMIANRFKGIRAIEISGNDSEMVRRGREHNDANVFCFGTDFIKENESIDLINVFLTTQFSGDVRHVRRIALLDDASIYE